MTLAIASISRLTICGIEELPAQKDAGVTHVLSMLDPDRADVAVLSQFDLRHRHLMRFHDIIDPEDGKLMPSAETVEAIVQYGEHLAASVEPDTDNHLLVHCHMGLSRSTAGLLILLAAANPDVDEETLFTYLRTIRPPAWPNSVMIELADHRLNRHGRLLAALRRHYAHQIATDPRYIAWMTGIKRDRELRLGGWEG
ncbi:tyrosine phosphatase family protein [Oryzibacter oryziterrae]|uniref:tyrosine phosphatase family protein n=1 Tax=Oryzibacter oryziterrae TaxID=2766474 RepID=UPI001F293953|nr:protein-tyrosine-phosphatase [Oryzibacter oryziterrae]